MLYGEVGQGQWGVVKIGERFIRNATGNMNALYNRGPGGFIKVNFLVISRGAGKVKRLESRKRRYRAEEVGEAKRFRNQGQVEMA